MNVIEKADKYANGKANEAITKAIAQAYIDGYRDGYKDRDLDNPADLSDNRTEYVDLGLPSHTLWSNDFEKDGDSYLFLPYEKAANLKIPTEEQWEELFQSCQWEYEIDQAFDFVRVKCIGPSGNVIVFNRTGIITSDVKSGPWEAFFWIESSEDGSYKNSIHMWNYGKVKFPKGVIKEGVSVIDRQTFSGYKLAVRLVR